MLERLGTISPWASKATDIAHSCGVEVHRVERVLEYVLTGAALVTLTIAMAWSGSWTDRVGPRLVLLWGVAAFVLAQVISGLAPTMTLFVAGRAVSEASGRITAATIGAIAAAGVDIISAGWITHSAPALDLGLDEG